MGLFSKVGSFIKENAHTILDVAGMIPGIGAVADLANAGLYAAEGDWVNAGLSAVSAIPGVGDTIALANKGMKVAKGAKAILKGGKGVKTLLKAGGKSIAKAVKGKMKVGGRLLKKLNPKSLYKSFKDKMKHVCLFGKCFTGDTLVYTEKGYVPISEIKVGDLVFSRDETTGEMGYKRVEQIFQTESHTIHIIEVNGSTVIRTTAYHRFYVEERGWVSAINLKEGDCLSTSEGQAFITGVEKARFEEPVIMYNFHVEDWVSYFVSEMRLYVHNGEGHGFIHGDLFEDLMNIDGVEIGALAETIVDGKNLILKDLAIYSNVGNIPNQIGAAQFKGWIKKIKNMAKEQGFESLQIIGERAAHSTSANPGSVINRIFKL